MKWMMLLSAGDGGAVRRHLSWAERRRYLNCIIMGAPGGGKGTISKRLVQDYSFVHISTGDLLRKHYLSESSSSSSSPSASSSSAMREIMRRGELVPDEMVLQMLRVELDHHHHRSVLLDGYPRTVAQARELDRCLQIHAVVSLDIPHEVILERMSNRWIHTPSGRTYSYDYNPPKVKGVDDVTGEPLSQREDDRPEVVRRRLMDYQTMTAPLLDYYRDRASSSSSSTATATAAATRDVHHHHQSSSQLLQVAEFRGSQSDLIYPQVKTFMDQLINRLH